MSTDIVIVVVALVLVLVIGLYTLGIYNRTVRGHERTMEAWSGIDVQLRRRTSLVPNLVETVSGYANHEQKVMEEVARARGALSGATGPSESSVANQALSTALGRLLAVSERYPQLQASGNFQDLQDELADIEEKIAYARQFYNRNAAEFNTRIRSAPDIVVARLLGFERFDFFEAEEGTTDDVYVHFQREQPPSASEAP